MYCSVLYCSVVCVCWPNCFSTRLILKGDDSDDEDNEEYYEDDGLKNAASARAGSFHDPPFAQGMRSLFGTQHALHGHCTYRKMKNIQERTNTIYCIQNSGSDNAYTELEHIVPCTVFYYLFTFKGILNFILFDPGKTNSVLERT